VVLPVEAPVPLPEPEVVFDGGGVVVVGVSVVVVGVEVVVLVPEVLDTY